MINPRRPGVIRMFALSVMLLTPLPYLGRSRGRQSPTGWPRTTASTHFGQVKGIRYTFSVERPGDNVSRSRPRDFVVLHGIGEGRQSTHCGNSTSTLPFLKLGCGQARTPAPRRERGELGQGRVRAARSSAWMPFIETGRSPGTKTAGRWMTSAHRL
jgi:hypothetical protein